MKFPCYLRREHVRRGVAFIALTLASFTSGCDSAPPSKGAGVAAKYQPGQVWTYAGRPGENASRLVILRVDSDPRYGEIVHVFIDGLSLRNPHTASGVATEIGHAPFSRDAIDQSVERQEGTRPLPDFEEGYATWRAAFDNGRAGVFTVPVADTIQGMESAMGQRN